MSGSCCVHDFHPIRAVRDFFEDIFCSDSCCVGNSSGPSDSERHAREVAKELAEMKEKTERSSSEIEEKVMDYINKSMDSFMVEIEKMNQESFFGEKLNINIKSIREKNEALNKQVVGCISSVMNARLVQTDKELSTILEEKDQKKRQENFSKFVENVEKQALGKLKKKIKKTVSAQSEVVSKEITTRQKEVDKKMEESIKELTEIMDVKEKSESDLKKKQIGYMYQSALCDLILSEVEK